MIAIYRSRTWPLVAAAVIVLVAVQVLASEELQRAPDPLVATAITFDLVIGLPLVVWFLLVRRRLLPPLVLVPVVVAGLVLANALVPDAVDQPVQLVTWAVPLGEAIVVLYLAYQLTQVKRSFNSGYELLWTDRLRASLTDTFGNHRAIDALATEVAILSFALFGWRIDPPHGRNTFSCHRANGVVPTMSALVAVTIVELFLVHFVVSLLWSTAAAWILSLLTIYGALWLIGDIQGLRKHRHLIDDQVVRVRIGLRCSADIPIDTILWAVPTQQKMPQQDGTISLTPIGDPTVWLKLSKPATIHGTFGTQRKADSLALAVDEPQRFCDALQP